jgi:ABC-type branched-subunit amino acid transport system ATPase component
MTTTEPIIRVENLSKQFLGVQALQDVSLRVHPGRIVGLYVPDRGSCTTFGRLADKLRPQEMGRIGYVASYYPGWNKDLEARYGAFRIGVTPGVFRLGNLPVFAVLAALCWWCFGSSLHHYCFHRDLALN